MREILKVRVGSHCHGCNMQDSDTDIRIIVIPTIEYFFGLSEFEQKVEKNEEKKQEIEYWNITKLFKLCCKGNPSSLNILFADTKDQLFQDKYGKALLAFRDSFLSKRIITACVGYTISQIHKIDIGRGRCGNRVELIHKFGYDTKFAYHALMMTNMSIELIKTGKYSPLRSPSEIQELKSVRTGEMQLDEVRHRIESNLKTIKTIESVCNLPDHPDEEEINGYLTAFLYNYFNEETSV